MNEKDLGKLGFTSNELAAAGAQYTSTPDTGKVGDTENDSTNGSIPDSTITDAAFDTSEVQQLARESLDFLAALAMPTIFQFMYPPVFISAWIWLTTYAQKVRDFSKLALGLPRGFGKTTVIKLLILFCILFTKKKFILVISSTATLAENILADIADMLDEPNIKATFGDWRIGMEKDTLGLKKFGYRGRNIILAGIGAGTSLRGMNLKNERPDVMIFEDFQTRENADSPVESDKLERWMIGTAMKAKSPAGCMYVFVANMYPTKHSLLRKLKANPEWIKFIAGGILNDGSSLWPELQPIEQLMSEFSSDLSMGHPEIFYSEVLNDENASVNNIIDLSKVPDYKYDDNEISLGNFVIIDPSNDKANSDRVAIGYFEVIDSKPVLRELTDDRLSPGETIARALEYCLRNNCTLVAIESNAYQYSLLYWFNFICLQKQITGIQCVDIYSGALSKSTRIMSMFKSLIAGEVLLHHTVRAPVYMQVTQYNPLKEKNVDDILDLLTYAPKVMSEYAEFIASTAIIAEQEWAGDKVLEHNSPF